MDVTGGSRCASCGTMNSPGASFCLSCGAPLAGPAPCSPQQAGCCYPQAQYFPQAQYYPYGQFQPQPAMVAQGGLVICPRCGQPAKKGGYQAWQIIVAIIFFPIGLLALLADKEPSTCPSCGFVWRA